MRGAGAGAGGRELGESGKANTNPAENRQGQEVFISPMSSPNIFETRAPLTISLEFASASIRACEPTGGMLRIPQRGKSLQTEDKRCESLANHAVARGIVSTLPCPTR